MSRTLLITLLPLVLGSCAVGPDYQNPDTADITPAQWQWQPAAPRDNLPRGEWWKVFHDRELDRLEALALAASPSLKAAVARVDQARAAGVLIELDGSAPIITDLALYRELAKQAMPGRVLLSSTGTRFVFGA